MKKSIKDDKQVKSEPLSSIIQLSDYKDNLVIIVVNASSITSLIWFDLRLLLQEMQVLFLNAIKFIVTQSYSQSYS